MTTTDTGAVVRSPTVDGASATITVPAASSTGGWWTPWVGIGDGPGYGLAQEGIELGDGPPFAWWALCATAANPGTGCGAQRFGGPVHAGDHVAMLTAELAHCRWRLAMADYGPGARWSASKTVAGYCIPTAAHDASWALEGGSQGQPLPRFAPLAFHAVRYQPAGAPWRPAAFSNRQAIWSNNANPNTGTVTICAYGTAAGDTVVVHWHNTCGSGTPL